MTDKETIIRLLTKIKSDHTHFHGHVEDSIKKYHPTAVSSVVQTDFPELHFVFDKDEELLTIRPNPVPEADADQW